MKRREPPWWEPTEPRLHGMRLYLARLLVAILCFLLAMLACRLLPAGGTSLQETARVIIMGMLAGWLYEALCEHL